MAFKIENFKIAKGKDSYEISYKIGFDKPLELKTTTKPIKFG